MILADTIDTFQAIAIPVVVVIGFLVGLANYNSKKRQQEAMKKSRERRLAREQELEQNRDRSPDDLIGK